MRPKELLFRFLVLSLSVILVQISLAQNNTYICGDVNCNGIVDSADSDILANYVVGNPGYSICREWIADVNCDGSIDLKDSIRIGKYVEDPENYPLECCSVCNLPGTDLDTKEECEAAGCDWLTHTHGCAATGSWSIDKCGYTTYNYSCSIKGEPYSWKYEGAVSECIYCDCNWCCCPSFNNTRCTDSDGGKNYYETGVVLDGGQGKIDYCIDSNNLKEYFCTNGVINSEIFTCPFGCKDGSCIEKMCSAEIVTEFSKSVYYVGDEGYVSVKIYDSNNNLIPNQKFWVSLYVNGTFAQTSSFYTNLEGFMNQEGQFLKMY